MDDETFSQTSHVSSNDGAFEREHKLHPSIEIDDDYDVTHNESHSTRARDTDEHSVLSSTTRRSFQSDGVELPYVDRSDGADDGASYMSDTSRKPGEDDEIGSQQHEGLDEDVFTDESPRSSADSYDHGSESGKAVDVDNMTTITRSSRASTVSHNNKDDFLSANRETSRPPFRAPFDAQNMPMASPPASIISSSRSSKKFPTVSRLGTPSVSAQYSAKRMSTPPRFKSRNEAPLVLLHATVLPLRWMWGDMVNSLDPAEMSKEVKALRDTWRLLQDRVGDTVIERGVLLSHPQSDYEVLEERLLEALDLPVHRRARILECGHYLGPSNESTIEEECYSDDDDNQDKSQSKPKRRWCTTCNGEIRFDPSSNVRAFRVKVYASNGLMRTGAWEACWKEMERVDVEVEPLVEPSVQDEIVRLAAAQQEREEEYEEHRQHKAKSKSLSSPSSPESAHTQRLREIYGHTPPRRESYARQGFSHSRTHSYGSPPAAGSSDASEQDDSGLQAAFPRGFLLRCLRFLVHDRRNVIIVTLGFFVLALALRSAQEEPPYEPIIHVMKTMPQVGPISVPDVSRAIIAGQKEHGHIRNHYAHSSSFVATGPFGQDAQYGDSGASLQPDQESLKSNSNNRKIYCSSPAGSSSSRNAKDWQLVVQEDVQETETITEKKVVTVTETQTQTQTQTQTEIAAATAVEPVVPEPTEAPVFEISSEDAEPVEEQECLSNPFIKPESQCLAEFLDLPPPDYIDENFTEQEESVPE